MKSTVLLSVDPPLSPGKIAAEAVASRGAVLTLADEPGQQYLIGEMRWRDETGVLFFIAFGDGARDARHLAIDTVTEESDGRIRFSIGGMLRAKLERVELAAVADPDDYRIAWQLWQQVAPLQRSVIDRSFTALTEG